MKLEHIKTVGVVGTGIMGSGIAQVFAQAGFTVLVHDISDDALKNAKASIEKSLNKFVSKGKFTENQAKETLNRLTMSNNVGDLKSVQMVIEAVTENEQIKTKVFQKLNDICPKDSIFASNTSTIPIGRLAKNVDKPDRFIGMHFMNPVPLMKLVEIINGFHTSNETTKVVCALAEKLDKTVVVSKDFPGFIVNRVLMPLINEAIFTLYEGVATKEDIDQAMTLGTNHPIGPLALADLIGLDTCLSIMEVIFEGFKDSKYRPCPLLRQYVEAGHLGRKSGRGFYVY